MCKQYCERMQSVKLETVYRSTDEEHLVFQNRIREGQPEKKVLEEYFGERQWKAWELDVCVQYGMELGKAEGTVFTWLTARNRGAAEVCEAALRSLGITADDLQGGFLCDPQTKSPLRILARPGIVIRLSRNLDKARGFVNRALAEVCESLRGNAVFMARLLGSGNYVLVHPMSEDGQVFLPCCYGYATTIRRAQGMSLKMGCIYMDQRKRGAGRGYAYVAVSRFQSRGGCHWFGKLRRSDFLPVGEEKEDEVLERGFESETTAESDVIPEGAGQLGEDIFASLGCSDEPEGSGGCGCGGDFD